MGGPLRAPYVWRVGVEGGGRDIDKKRCPCPRVGRGEASYALDDDSALTVELIGIASM